ncbi:hypothetical protein [Porticoccus sp.]
MKLTEALIELILGSVAGYFVLTGLTTGKIPYPSKLSYALPDAELALNPEGYWYSIAMFATGTIFLIVVGVLSMKKVVFPGPERFEH